MITLVVIEEAWFTERPRGCANRNGGCEHICVDGRNGHFQCKCRPGFTLAEDRRSCKGTK